MATRHYVTPRRTRHQKPSEQRKRNEGHYNFLLAQDILTTFLFPLEGTIIPTKTGHGNLFVQCAAVSICPGQSQAALPMSNDAQIHILIVTTAAGEERALAIRPGSLHGLPASAAATEQLIPAILLCCPTPLIVLGPLLPLPAVFLCSAPVVLRRPPSSSSAALLLPFFVLLPPDVVLSPLLPLSSSAAQLHESQGAKWLKDTDGFIQNRAALQ
ncbi:uncharacterized protein LOC142465487 [Ascaphus truei]|uniref:uncharacterized protein LOC142465487 n=1 Tax=Ascaphus truei TaxID=8439 RepID=UPI003F5A0B8F